MFRLPLPRKRVPAAREQQQRGSPRPFRGRIRRQRGAWTALGISTTGAPAPTFAAGGAGSPISSS